jgi:hypothetical protein
MSGKDALTSSGPIFSSPLTMASMKHVDDVIVAKELDIYVE